MGDGGVEGRQLVLQAVRRPVLVAPDAREPLVAEHPRPHDVRTRLVVLGVRKHARCLGAHGPHEREVQVVSHGDRAHVVEEALKQVAEHVGDARGRLVRGQREGELGVHERELRALMLVAVPRLHAERVVADHGVLRRLAARRGDGEDHGDGEHVLVGALRGEELPHVLVDAGAVRNRLRRVDDRPAADREHPVDAFLLAQGHALPHELDLGIRAHAAELHALDARRIERRAHAVDEPASHRALPAEVQKHLLRAALGELAAHFLLGAPAEDELSRRHELEIKHGNILSRCARCKKIACDVRRYLSVLELSQ